jgi:hypothetical protein
MPRSYEATWPDARLLPEPSGDLLGLNRPPGRYEERPICRLCWAESQNAEISMIWSPAHFVV